MPQQRAPARQERQGRSWARGMAPLAAVTAMVLLWAAAGYAQPFQPANIFDAMDAAIYLNRMKAACVDVGFSDMLNSPDFNGTVFAPVDLGFDSALQSLNTTLENLSAQHKTELKGIVSLHIVPGTKYFPLSALKTGAKMPTLGGNPLTVNLDVPGIVHVYGGDPEAEPLNFATVLQYQEIRGGKAVLYVIDRVLMPPSTAAARALAANP